MERSRANEDVPNYTDHINLSFNEDVPNYTDHINLSFGIC